MALTGHAEPHDYVRSREAGFEAHVKKRADIGSTPRRHCPFVPDRVVRRSTEKLGGKHVGRAADLAPDCKAKLNP